jgi:hypothetical protein
MLHSIVSCYGVSVLETAKVGRYTFLCRPVFFEVVVALTAVVLHDEQLDANTALSVIIREAIRWAVLDVF